MVTQALGLRIKSDLHTPCTLPVPSPRPSPRPSLRPPPAAAVSRYPDPVPRLPKCPDALIEPTSAKLSRYPDPHLPKTGPALRRAAPVAPPPVDPGACSPFRALPESPALLLPPAPCQAPALPKFPWLIVRCSFGGKIHG